MTLEDLKQKTFLFDSHTHLGFEGYKTSTENIIKASKNAGVEELFDVSVDIASSRENIERAKQFKEVKALVGIDPEAIIPGSELYKKVDNVEQWIEQEIETLEELIINNKDLVIGIGETGIDLHHLRVAGTSEDEVEKSKKLQTKLYEKQLQLAEKYNLFLSIHSRGAEAYCLEVLKKYNVKGIFHSFTGDFKTAEAILEHGCALGVNGIVTFKNSHNLRLIYKTLIGKLPEGEVKPDFFYKKGIFFETDAPFLSPEGKRGEINESANIKVIFDKLVEYLRS
ncbi:MAG: TatD family hydrolase [Candidatus Dojkabacteria bacterium]